MNSKHQQLRGSFWTELGLDRDDRTGLSSIPLSAIIHRCEVGGLIRRVHGRCVPTITNDS